MREQYLRKKEIAAMLALRYDKAAAILAKYGCHAIDLGPGRGNGKRWLKSAVNAAMLQMHLDAQPKSRVPQPKKPKISNINLADMSADQLYGIIPRDEKKLTSATPLQ